MFLYYMDLYELNLFFPVIERYQSLFFVCLFVCFGFLKFDFATEGFAFPRNAFI